MSLKLLPIHHEDIVDHQAFCGLPFQKIILNAEGYVSMCCYQFEQLGNLLEDQTILDLWNSPKAQAIREATLRGELHSVCCSWNVCPYLVMDKTPGPIRAYKKFTYPTHLEICLPDKHCNVGGENPSEENPACIMCIRNHRKPAQPDLTAFFCEKAKPLMPFLKHLCVLGIAEPFWRDKVFEVFEWLEFSRYNSQIRFETNTNGMLLSDRVNERFFEAVKWSDISFSLDAASPETFVKIRRIDCYDMVIRNIKHYMKLRNSEVLHAYQHVTKIWNNINMLNVHEMEQMVRTAADLGVDSLVMLPTHDQNGNVHLGELLLNSKNVSVFARHAEAAKTLADKMGVCLIYAKPFDKVPPPVQQARVDERVGPNFFGTRLK